MWRIRIPFFRIFYSTTYTVLLLITLVLLAATPGDHVYQILSNHNIGDIFVVGGTYLVTAILATFIFASRLYTNKATLAAIPRSYLPIEKGEVSRNVRRIIVSNRQRSAMIAYESRPRDLRQGYSNSLNKVHEVENQISSNLGDAVIHISPDAPPWGEIMHPGWSSPSSEEFPSLEYEKIICELPNLIEAKAVSLAPPNPAFNFMAGLDEDIFPEPDPQIVALLQRPSTIGLRDYLTHLNSLGLISSQALLANFLTQYEYARFSSHALIEVEFRQLMTAFSELLAGVVALDTGAFAEFEFETSSEVSSQRSKRRHLSSTLSNRPPSISSVSSSTQSVIHHDRQIVQWSTP